MEFIESFMKFSFSDDDIFRIEEDELVKDVENVKACECVVLISENVALIEAKSSSPRIENEEKFQKFISDIGQKFADSLQLFSDIKSKEKGDEAFQRLPVNLQNTQIATEAYKIYLIIHGHQLDWLLGLMDALRKELNDVVKQWNLRDSNVKVYNEATALENKLIVAYIPKAETKALRLPDGSVDDAKVQAWFAAHEDDEQ
jgi:hypothetical protein